MLVAATTAVIFAPALVGAAVGATGRIDIVGVDVAVLVAVLGVTIALPTVLAIAAARQLRRDREYGDAETCGARVIQRCVQPVKKLKQVLCIKNAYRF